MFSKFQSKELSDFLEEQVKNQKTKIQPYYQTLNKQSEKPYVMHEKTNQITVVLEGQGIAVLDGEQIEISENDILLLPRKTKHSFVCRDSTLELFHIHIPLDEIENDRYILREDIMEKTGKKRSEYEGI